MTYATNPKYRETLSPETVEKKFNRPKAEEFSLPRLTKEAGFSWRAALQAMLKKPRKFMAGGLAAVSKSKSLIEDPQYRDRWAATLGEYADWYFCDKSFLHSIHWMGVPTRKMIFDIWVYHEIIFETKPDVILEIGSWFGGSTLFLGNVCDNMNHGEVISIDINHDAFRGHHPRVTTITGDCSDPHIVQQVKDRLVGKTVMVIHDGDHQRFAVARDLEIYAPLVTPGMYLVVEDGIVDLFAPEHSKLRRAYPDGGPLQPARDVAVKWADDFELDMTRERFILTTNPSGYYRRRVKGN
ncbi:MAG: CmcI family methyltransferase [Bdellovibrionales bacterium]